jgi:hypothetical protein
MSTLDPLVIFLILNALCLILSVCVMLIPYRISHRVFQVNNTKKPPRGRPVEAKSRTATLSTTEDDRQSPIGRIPPWKPGAKPGRQMP